MAIRNTWSLLTTSRQTWLSFLTSDTFKDFEDVEFHASTQREAGTDGKWFLVIVEVPFRYYDGGPEE